MATVGQFDPNQISASDPKGDFVARIVPDGAETVPNWIGRAVTFFYDVNNKFDGDVVDHQGNEITIVYRVETPVTFNVYKVAISSRAGSSSGTIFGNEKIRLDP
jgi:hypothetical protein